MIAAIAVVYGLAAAIIFRGFTDRVAMRSSWNRILAHMMELSLFLESPRLVFGAQRDLLLENARLLRLILVPGVMMVLLFALLYVPLEAMHAPLPMGEPSVVTIRMKDALMPVRLEAPPGIAVETPGVRSVRDREVSWRVRPLRESSGDFKFHTDNRVIVPSIFLRDPVVRSIEIRYPKAVIWGFSWMVWFIAISSASAVSFGLFWKR